MARIDTFTAGDEVVHDGYGVIQVVRTGVNGGVECRRAGGAVLWFHDSTSVAPTPARLPGLPDPPAPRLPDRPFAVGDRVHYDRIDYAVVGALGFSVRLVPAVYAHNRAAVPPELVVDVDVDDLRRWGRPVPDRPPHDFAHGDRIQCFGGAVFIVVSTTADKVYVRVEGGQGPFGMDPQDLRAIAASVDDRVAATPSAAPPPAEPVPAPFVGADVGRGRRRLLF